MATQKQLEKMVLKQLEKHMPTSNDTERVLATRAVLRDLSMHGLGCPECGSNDESNMGTKNGKHWCGNCGNEW